MQLSMESLRNSPHFTDELTEARRSEWQRRRKEELSQCCAEVPGNSPPPCPVPQDLCFGAGLLASASLTLGPSLYRFRFPTIPAGTPCPWPTRCSTSPVWVSGGLSQGQGERGARLDKHQWKKHRTGTQTRAHVVFL